MDLQALAKLADALKLMASKVDETVLSVAKLEHDQEATSQVIRAILKSLPIDEKIAASLNEDVAKSKAYLSTLQGEVNGLRLQLYKQALSGLLPYETMLTTWPLTADQPPAQN